jgi:very-short-patch-repair endonuclease
LRKVDGTEALERVRELRREMTPAERRLWSRLRGRRLGGFKFKRQEWVGPFIADFYCREARLVVEVDGTQHADRDDYDRARSAYLKREGFRVGRFWNNQVMEELEGVLAAILAILEDRVPSPSRRAPRAGSLHRGGECQDRPGDGPAAAIPAGRGTAEPKGSAG